MRLPLIVASAAIAAFVVGCGGHKPDAPTGDSNPPAPVLGRPAQAKEAARDLGFPGFATKNTTRVGGADPVADAAGVAQAVYPGAAEDSRPGVVTIVDAADFQSAVSAAQLMAPPLRSPILYSQDGDLPQASQDALDAMHPAGAPDAGDAQVIRVGDRAGKPEGLKSTDVAGTKAPAVAKAIDRLASAAAGAQSQAVIVAGSEDPAYAMPAAGLAAKTGAPVLWTDKDKVPGATREAIASRKKPRIYVIGPTKVVSDKAFKALEKLGPAERISGGDPIENAIAVARYADGPFGWNVVDPGHGLVFAAADRPGEAAAAVALSGTGTYGPLLLVDDPDTLPDALESYLLDIQPGYDKDPVRGVYNHAWLLGDEDAIGVPVQARIDSLLEIQPVTG
ncbi:MAG: hypothetical protein QOI80_683 [Solirubrobacteraceae bacterium]|jgi:hypothetical protein|nr:hypothetical protein [Solirubrobacteraceae bacterium]